MWLDTMYVTVIGNKMQNKTVKHECLDSIYQRVDMDEIGKLHNLQ